MPNSKTMSATSALNEDKYINKLYDNVIEKQKDLLGENQEQAMQDLAAESVSVQQQADTNLGRVDVEAQKTQQNFTAPNVSSSAQQQIALAMDNQRKKNITATQTVQSEADAQIERQRILLGQQFEAEIKRAQANNDMLRAQQLYEAARAEDQRLMALKQEAGSKLAALGDNSVLEALAGANPVTRDTETQTWDQVLSREGEINKVFDASMEVARQDAAIARNEALAKIQAAQAAEAASTGRNLNEAYVGALKRAKNYNEVQNAYGLGSGNMAQARLAQALGLTENLANQRNIFAGNTAVRGQQRLTAEQRMRDTIAEAQESTENARAQALYDAAEAEEQTLIENQRNLGAALAQQGDYSVLGALYGLTQDQIDRLQGTGVYAPSESHGGNGGSGPGSDAVTTLSDALSAYYGGESQIGKDVEMTEEEAEELFERLDQAKELDAQIAEQEAWKQEILQGNKTAARERQALNVTNTSNTTVAAAGAPGAIKPVTSMLQTGASARNPAYASVKNAIALSNPFNAATSTQNTKQTVRSEPAEDPAAAAGKAIGAAIANALRKNSRKK